MSGRVTIGVDVPKAWLLRANGGQGNVYANAQRAKHLRHAGYLAGRDWLARHRAWRRDLRVDVEYEMHYPRRPPRADPDNLAPTVKHLVDGLTDAGMWADDDYTHLRRRTYTMGEPTNRAGVWRIDIHITPAKEQS
ncbi:MAG: hypothetical protein U0N15_05740 [Bifidobacterium choerinum]